MTPTWRCGVQSLSTATCCWSTCAAPAAPARWPARHSQTTSPTTTSAPAAAPTAWSAAPLLRHLAVGAGHRERAAGDPGRPGRSLRRLLRLLRRPGLCRALPAPAALAGAGQHLPGARNRPGLRRPRPALPGGDAAGLQPLAGLPGQRSGLPAARAGAIRACRPDRRQRSRRRRHPAARCRRRAHVGDHHSGHLRQPRRPARPAGRDRLVSRRRQPAAAAPGGRERPRRRLRRRSHLVLGGALPVGHLPRLPAAVAGRHAAIGPRRDGPVDVCRLPGVGVRPVLGRRLDRPRQRGRPGLRELAAVAVADGSADPGRRHLSERAHPDPERRPRQHHAARGRPAGGVELPQLEAGGRSRTSTTCRRWAISTTAPLASTPGS